MNSLSSGYRRFVWPWWKHWFSPRTYWYYVKWKWQRANRGWADCDIWSLDCYLSRWLPDALRKLKQDKQGVPMSAFPDGSAYMDENGAPPDLAMEEASKNWDAVLVMIIEGFEAKNRIDRGDNLRWVRGDAVDDWLVEGRAPSEKTKQIYKAAEEADKADRKVAREGLKRFAEVFEDLWN